MSLFPEAPISDRSRRPKGKTPARLPGEVYVEPSAYPGCLLVTVDEGTGRYGRPCSSTGELGAEYPSGTIFRDQPVMLDSVLMSIVIALRTACNRWGGGPTL